MSRTRSEITAPEGGSDITTSVRPYLAFIAAAGILLMVLLMTSVLLFEREMTPTELLMALTEREQPSLTERLLSPGRTMAEPMTREKSPTRDSHQARGVTGAGGAATTVRNREQLVLRETVLTQQILQDRYGLSRDAAWLTVRRAASQGTFREYEEMRFLRETLWQSFEEKSARPLIGDNLQRMSERIAKRPEAFFEDHLYAGLADLFDGRGRTATEHLERALASWPSRGRMWGNAYLALLISYAVIDAGDRVVTMLQKFRDNYPDWLYTETFLTDLDDLHEIYPDAGLLWMVRGRLVQYVNDHREAATSFQRAAASTTLSPAIRQTVNEWLEQVEPSP